MKKKILLLNLLMFSCVFSFYTQTAVVSKEMVNPGETSIRQASFDKVWNTINEKHYDPTFGGVDWKKVRETYEPLAMKAKSGDEFNGVLNKMLGELKLSHFAVFTPPAGLDTTKVVNGVVGIELKMIDKQAVVSRVQSDSTAEQAGLKTGFVIKKIDDKTAAELLAPLEASFAARTLPEAQKNLYRQQILLNRVNGNVASKVKLEVLDGKNRLRNFEVSRIRRKGEMSPALGNFPPQEVNFESRRLTNNIGYFHFNIWVIPQMAKIREAIRSMKDAPGIIIDLRGNPGGIGGMATGTAGLLIKEQTSLGTMKGRENETKFIVYPQTAAYQGKVIVLTDVGSGSTSEVFAAGMQEINRALVVGEKSAGAILLSVIDKLPTGALFQYAISDYKSPKNILIEGRGVIPDVEVKQTRQSLLDGRDLVIEEAIKQINKTN